MYSTVRVVASTLRSDHKAIVVYATQSVAGYKAKYTKLFRPISPAQHAQFPQYISAFVSADDWSYIDTMDTQDAFNEFYDAVLGLINYFYPERTITVTTTDPYYITPASKVKLRRKNRLRRAGRVQEADALAAQIGRDIANRNKTRLSKIHRKTSSKDLSPQIRNFADFWAISPHLLSQNGKIWREGANLGDPPPCQILEKSLKGIYPFEAN